MIVSFTVLKQIMKKISSFRGKEIPPDIYNHIDFSKLQKLRANLFSHPLSYFQEKVKNKIQGLSAVSGILDKISLVIYDTQRFLKDSHILKASFEDIRLDRILPTIE